MKRALFHIGLSIAILLPAALLQALGEIRTTILDSAIPQTRVGVYYGSAFSAGRSRDLPFLDRDKVYAEVPGVMLGVRVNPRLELGGNLSFKDNNKGLELQAKVLAWQRDNKYLSIVPALVSSQGKVSRDSYWGGGDYSVINWEDNCQASGFSLPAIYSLDTRRNLTVNASAGLSCVWVKTWGEYDRWDAENHVYHAYSYDFSPEPMWRAQANLNVVARFFVLYVVPEIGIAIVDTKDQGVQDMFSYGLGFGARW